MLDKLIKRHRSTLKQWLKFALLLLALIHTLQEVMKYIMCIMATRKLVVIKSACGSTGVHLSNFHGCSNDQRFFIVKSVVSNMCSAKQDDVPPGNTKKEETREQG